MGDNFDIKADLLQQHKKYDSFTPLAHDSLPMLLLRKLMATYKRGVEITNLPLLPTDPKLMESTQARQNASTQPAAIPALNRVARCMNLGLYPTETQIRKRELLMEDNGRG